MNLCLVRASAVVAALYEINQYILDVDETSMSAKRQEGENRATRTSRTPVSTLLFCVNARKLDFASSSDGKWSIS